MKRLPDEVRQMTVEDYLDLVATLTPDQAGPIPWEKGGRGVLKGWVETMKAQGGKTSGNR